MWIVLCHTAYDTMIMCSLGDILFEEVQHVCILAKCL